MLKEEIKAEFEELNDTLVQAIIDSCKELVCKGVPMYDWDRETVAQNLDKVLDDWYCL